MEEINKQALTASLSFSVQESDRSENTFYKEKDKWLSKAETSKPELQYQSISPLRIVKSIKDITAFQGWRIEDVGTTDQLYHVPFKEHPVITVDFGNHYTGYIIFSIKAFSLMAANAPIRLKFTMAEMPAELNTPFEPYPGTLASSWEQTEIITITEVPSIITLPRRLSGRYLKIELLGISKEFDFVFDSLVFKTQTSAIGVPSSLAPQTDGLIQDIYRVGVNTLKECMQTVYEDGPKRDRRLWIGDLYLESLTNAQTFRNHTLTKRCLYLLAACANADGMLHGTVLERPYPHPEYGILTLDYALLYNVTLLEYFKETKDRETAEDLWTVVCRQIEIALGLFSSKRIYDAEKGARYWLVFDWNDEYDRQASMQALMVFALRKSFELACLLGKEKEVFVECWPTIADELTVAARKVFYDEGNGIVVSGKNGQISWLSQAWMIISGILNKKEGMMAMSTVMDMEKTCYPGCPYGWHYVMEALIECGMAEEARSLLVGYWGDMIKRGADTFWEVYDPDNDTFSPYNFFPINSYCHAWSCTPVYFIRKYPEIFQK